MTECKDTRGFRTANCSRQSNILLQPLMSSEAVNSIIETDASADLHSPNAPLCLCMSRIHLNTYSQIYQRLSIASYPEALHDIGRSAEQQVFLMQLL